MHRKATAAVAAAAWTLLVAAPALPAQSIMLEADGGIQFPFGQLADSISAGPAGGVGIGYEVGRGFGLALRGEASRLDRDDDGLVTPGGPTGPAPDLTHWQFVAEGRLRPLSTTGPTDLVLSAGAGVAVFRFAGDFLDQRFRSTSTHPTLRGGATLEVSVSPKVALTAATRLKFVLSEEEQPPVPPFDETLFLNLSVGGWIGL